LLNHLTLPTVLDITSLNPPKNFKRLFSNVRHVCADQAKKLNYDR